MCGDGSDLVSLQAQPLRAHRKSVEEWNFHGVKLLLRPNTKDVDAAKEVTLVYMSWRINDRCTRNP